MKKEKKFMKKSIMILIFTFLLAAVPVISAQAGNVKPKKISAVGKQTRTVYVGDEIELKVKMYSRSADDDYLRWKILSGSKNIKFDGDDRDGDDAEFKAKKVGTAKVRCYILGTKKVVDFTVKVKKAPKKIRADGKTTKTVEIGDDFDLEIKKYAGLKNSSLKWSIENKKIVNFHDRVRSGKEVEFDALRLGKTKVTCTDTKTKQKVVFNIRVVRDAD